MEAKELESLVTRLLDTKSITAKEAIELLKLSQPVITYIDRPFYVRDYGYGSWPLTTTRFSDTATISTTTGSCSSLKDESHV